MELPQRALFAMLVAACGSKGGPVTTIDAATAGDASVVDAAPPARLIAYVSGYGPLIAWFDVDADTGALAPAGAIMAFRDAPSFLVVAGSHLFAASEATDRIGAYSIDPATGQLAFVNEAAAGGSGPAHVAVDRTGRRVFASNYGDGTVSVLAVGADGGVAAPRQTLDLGDNAHELVISPDNRHAFVPCLGSDYVAQLDFDPATGALTANAVPHFMTATGAGPRHLAFAPDGAHVYLLNERGNTLTVAAYVPSTGQLSALDTVSTRAPGATGTNTGAEIAVHPNGAFVYASNRGDNTIATFAIDATTGLVTPVAQTPTQGVTPRSFTVDPSGRFLYVANQGSNTVVPFRIDATTGIPGSPGTPITATSPSYVGLVALP